MVYLEPIATLRARCQQNKRKLKYCSTVNLNDLPKVVSYRSQCALPLYDQQQMGSCTANVLCNHIRNLGLQSDPSRHWVYFLTSAQEQKNQVIIDQGADLADSNFINVLGVCDEVFMEYNVTNMVS